MMRNHIKNRSVKNTEYSVSFIEPTSWTNILDKKDNRMSHTALSTKTLFYLF